MSGMAAAPQASLAAEAARRNGVQLASSTDSGTGEVIASRAETHANDVHKVGRGESLSSIARQYGVSVGALKSANQINSNTVRAGTTLTIPAG